MAYESIQRLPDPTTNPTGPGFTTAGLSDEATGLVHQLNNGSIVSVQYAGNFWNITITYPQLTTAEASVIMPFLNSVLGGFVNFYVQLPMFINPRTGAWDIATAAKRAEGAITLGSTDRQIIISNWSSRGGNLSPGDMIKFTNSNKIYQVQTVSLVSNVMTVNLHCPIIEPSKVATSGLEPNDIKFRVKLQAKQLSFTWNTSGLIEVPSIALTENIL